MPFPCVRTDLVVSPRPNGEGVLIYDPTTDTGHVLEGAAAIVFAACDGKACREDLAFRVSIATETNFSMAEVDSVISELSEAGLLKGSQGMSRRVLIGGLVAGAAIVAAAPLVTSIAKPASANNLFPSLDPPAVLPATASTTAGVPVQIPLASTGFNPDSVVYWNVNQPAHGTVTVTNTSSGGVNTGAYATYVPDPGYTGPDSFDYVAGECQGIGAYSYPATPEAQAACPTALYIGGAVILSATVSITVVDEPATTSTTTVPADESTPKYTG
jgi:hypothetical protein